MRTASATRVRFSLSCPPSLPLPSRSRTPTYSYPGTYTDTFPTGKPVSHAFAKELLAGFVGGEVDKLAETKGADWIDREEATRHAKKNAAEMYDQHYGGQDQYDPNQQQQHESFNNY